MDDFITRISPSYSGSYDHYNNDDYDVWNYAEYLKRRKKSYRSSIGNSGDLSRAVSYYGSYGRYSSSFYSGYSKEDSETSKLIVRSYKSIKDLITIMDFPYSINIEVMNKSEDDEDYYSSTIDISNSRRIFVQSSVFDNNKKSSEEKMNIFCGYGLHEAAHLRYTYYKVYAEFSNSLQCKEKLTDNSKNFIKFLVNLLEDNRIEDLLLTDRPGFQEFIDAQREYTSEQVKNTKFFKSKKKDDSSNDLLNFFLTLIGLIRFPELIDENYFNKYSEIYKKIQEKFIPNYPKTLRDICNTAFSIFSVIEDAKLADKMILDLIYGEISLLMINNRSDDNEIIPEMIYGLDIDSGNKRKSYSIASVLRSSKSMTAKILKGTCERGESDATFFEKKNGSKSEYLEIVKKINKYIPRLKKIINEVDKNYDFNIYGCRSGLLDTTKLAEAYQGVPQVYVRQGHIRTNNSTICVLIDESGSMSGNRERLARNSAVLLNETFGKSPGIDLYIYGHTADVGASGYVNISVYKEGSYYNPKFALTSSCAKYQNRDGDAILEVAKRIRKFTKNRCIMFVISDGCPCANGYGGSGAIKDTAMKIKKAEQLDFDIIQISIDAVQDVEEMFSNFIDIGYDLENMPKLLNEIIKTNVVKNKKTTIS